MNYLFAPMLPFNSPTSDNRKLVFWSEYKESDLGHFSQVYKSYIYIMVKPWSILKEKFTDAAWKNSASP